MTPRQTNFLEKLKKDNFDAGTKAAHQLSQQQNFCISADPILTAAIKRHIEHKEMLENISLGSWEEYFEPSIIINTIRETCLGSEQPYVNPTLLEHAGLLDRSTEVEAIAKAAYDSGVSSVIAQWVRRKLMAMATDLLKKEPQQSLAGSSEDAEQMWKEAFDFIHRVHSAAQKCMDAGSEVTMGENGGKSIKALNDFAALTVRTYDEPWYKYFFK